MAQYGTVKRSHRRAVRRMLNTFHHYPRPKGVAARVVRAILAAGIIDAEELGIRGGRGK